MKLIRIVVLQFNQSQYTIQLVKDLLFQKNADYEIVIVDNGSRKEEYENIKNISSASNIWIVRSEINLGYAKGNNLGCEFETGNKPDYFLILNNDIRIDNINFIHELVRCIDGNKNTIAASPLVNTLSTKTAIEKQIQVRRIPKNTWQVIILGSPVLKRLFKNIFNKYIYKDLMPFVNKINIVESINGAAFLVKSNEFRELGCFDKNTFLYFEEIIMGYKFKSTGLHCILNGNLIVDHFQGISGYNLNKQKHKLESEKYFLIKHLSPSFFTYCIYKLVRKIDAIFSQMNYLFQKAKQCFIY